jgi:hypothetical protein
MDFHGINLEGYLKRKVTAVTQAASPYALTLDMSGQIFTNTGATGDVTFTLPDIDGEVGISFTFVKLVSSGILIDANAGQYIADSVSGGRLSNTTSDLYAAITVISVSSTVWYVDGGQGIWIIA